MDNLQKNVYGWMELFICPLQNGIAWLRALSLGKGGSGSFASSFSALPWPFNGLFLGPSPLFLFWVWSGGTFLKEDDIYK